MSTELDLDEVTELLDEVKHLRANQADQRRIIEAQDAEIGRLRARLDAQIHETERAEAEMSALVAAELAALRPRPGVPHRTHPRGLTPVIVTVTPTIMDGTVVRWYRSEAGEVRGDVVSASREGVLVRCYLHQVPVSVLGAAQAVYETLREDNNADVSHLATHSRHGLFGPLEPVAFRSPSTESETP